MVRPAPGNAGQAITPLTPSAAASASPTGPMLPSGVESKVEQYLKMIWRQPCAFSHSSAASDWATASAAGIERLFSETMPASQSGGAGLPGTPRNCTVASPPVPPPPLASVLAMSDAPV